MLVCTLYDKYYVLALDKPLTLIINQSLITGMFPEQLKLAKVIPLYKKYDKLIMGNYRPMNGVGAFKFLGVTLDENLTWKSHTDKVATQLFNYSVIINKLKNHLPLYILKALYNSLVQPHLNHAILVWVTNATDWSNYKSDWSE